MSAASTLQSAVLLWARLGASLLKASRFDEGDDEAEGKEDRSGGSRSKDEEQNRLTEPRVPRYSVPIIHSSVEINVSLSIQYAPRQEKSNLQDQKT